MDTITASLKRGATVVVLALALWAFGYYVAFDRMKADVQAGQVAADAAAKANLLQIRALEARIGLLEDERAEDAQRYRDLMDWVVTTRELMIKYGLDAPLMPQEE